jgi:hypothetical protein
MDSTSTGDAKSTSRQAITAHAAVADEALVTDGGGMAILSFSTFLASVAAAVTFSSFLLASAPVAAFFFFFFSRPALSALQRRSTGEQGNHTAGASELTCTDGRADIIVDFPTLLQVGVVVKLVLLLSQLLQIQVG